jgi:hypothetical protein
MPSPSLSLSSLFFGLVSSTVPLGAAATEGGSSISLQLRLKGCSTWHFGSI